jgi:hypothetical protein
LAIQVEGQIAFSTSLETQSSRVTLLIERVAANQLVDVEFAPELSGTQQWSLYYRARPGQNQISFSLPAHEHGFFRLHLRESITLLAVDDPDHDGLSTAFEYENGTSPYQWDSDGDGAPDRTDDFPKDPGRHTLLVPTTLDTTPPSITLNLPAWARLIE